MKVDDVRLAAQSGALQVFAEFFVVEILAKFQLIDDALHEALRRRAKPAGLTILRCHFGKPRRAHFAALDRHLLHAAVHLVTLQHRQRNRQNGREHANRGEHRRDELRIYHRFDEGHHWRTVVAWSDRERIELRT